MSWPPVRFVNRSSRQVALRRLDHLSRISLFVTQGGSNFFLFVLMQQVYKGSCFCKLVSYEVRGRPILSAYCHCTVCQRLTSCPFVHTVHFPDSAFMWTHEEPNEKVLHTFSPPEKQYKTRYRCSNCGACVASKNSKANKWSIWVSQLERNEEGKLKYCEELKPTAHMFYGTRMVDVNDGIGKWLGYENKSERVNCSWCRRIANDLPWQHHSIYTCRTNTNRKRDGLVFSEPTLVII